MVVVKLGGSLYNSSYLQEWLAVLAVQAKQSVIIVPGGGPFAEQVRLLDKQLTLPEETSHAMAVLGMQQYAYMLHGLQPTLSFVSSIDGVPLKEANKSSLIWLPYNDVLASDELQKHWQTTSDSIALWLAIKLQANQLFLIKSASLDNKSTNDLVHSDIVDDHFQPMLEGYTGVLEFMHAADANQFMNKLIA